jgi:hypothetical protein
MSFRMVNVAERLVEANDTHAQKDLEEFIEICVTNKTLLRLSEYEDIRIKILAFSKTYPHFIAKQDLPGIFALCMLKAVNNKARSMSNNMPYNNEQILSAAKKIYAIISGTEEDVTTGFLNKVNAMLIQPVSKEKSSKDDSASPAATSATAAVMAPIYREKLPRADISDTTLDPASIVVIPLAVATIQKPSIIPKNSPKSSKIYDKMLTLFSRGSSNGSSPRSADSSTVSSTDSTPRTPDQ